MRNRKYGLSLLLLFPSLLSVNFRQQMAFQGIEGHVYFVSGNQMPSPDVKPTKPKGLKTTIYIYELTNLNQVKKQDHSPFYTSILTKLVKRGNSGKDGHFRVSLPAGQYSIFVKKDSLFFANWFDGNNNIAPVKVAPDSTSKIDIKVDYNASY
jgi:hypothetical protein